MSSLVGKTLGQFEVLEQIGHGGSGTVYKAYQSISNRFVAVKVFPRSYTNNQSIMELLNREAPAMTHLRHSHILPVIDFNPLNDIGYMVTEYISGGSLAHRLKHGPLPLRDAINLSLQACQALD